MPPGPDVDQGRVVGLTAVGVVLERRAQDPSAGRTHRGDAVLGQRSAERADHRSETALVGKFDLGFDEPNHRDYANPAKLT